MYELGADVRTAAGSLGEIVDIDIVYSEVNGGKQYKVYFLNTGLDAWYREHELAPANEDSWTPKRLMAITDYLGEPIQIEPDNLVTEWVPGPDLVKHPPHYESHPSGVECIEITRHMGYCLGNAMKYIWRADLKEDALADLRKAREYLDFEIELREGRPVHG